MVWPPRDQATMWCGVDQLTWRSQPGHRQPRSRVRSARRVGADTTRVALPTSMTMESASSTRDMVQSQAMRSRLRVEIGSESSRSAGGCAERVLQALKGGGQVEVRLDAVAPVPPALGHGVGDGRVQELAHELSGAHLVIVPHGP